MYSDQLIHHRNEIHHEQRGHGEGLGAGKGAHHPDDLRPRGGWPDPGLDRPVDGDLLQDARETVQVGADVEYLVPEGHAREQVRGVVDFLRGESHQLESSVIGEEEVVAGTGEG